MHNKLPEIDKTWTLFLDRDGVINRRPFEDYVKKWEEFEFLPGVLSAIDIFSGIFNRIIIVTNQQGIGKNLMTKEELHAVHSKMISEIENTGGKVDAIFHCPDLATKPVTCRKPGIKMAEWAKVRFPEIDFTKSIMAGDTISDMQFGQNAGMTTILIGNSEKDINNKLFVKQFDSLFDFASAISANV